MLFNCKQCNKHINSCFIHYTVCVLSLLTCMMVLMTWKLAQMKVWRIRMPKNADYNAKIVIKSELRANDHFLSLMNFTSCSCWPFHANRCVFSRNELEKVYTCPNFLLNLLLAFWVYPESYGDTQNALTPPHLVKSGLFMSQAITPLKSMVMLYILGGRSQRFHCVCGFIIFIVFSFFALFCLFFCAPL